MSAKLSPLGFGATAPLHWHFYIIEIVRDNGGVRRNQYAFIILRFLVPAEASNPCECVELWRGAILHSRTPHPAPPPHPRPTTPHHALPDELAGKQFATPTAPHNRRFSDSAFYVPERTPPHLPHHDLLTPPCPAPPQSRRTWRKANCHTSLAIAEFPKWTQARTRTV